MHNNCEDALGSLNLQKSPKKMNPIKLSLIGLSLIFCSTTFAQNVAINTTGAVANSSAILDVSSTNTGLLVPRLSLTMTTAAAPVTAPATSLLVYNTATVADVTPGYYYWNGVMWVRLDSNENDWLLNGNAGTNDPAVPGTYGTSLIGANENWMGTSDGNDVVIGTNNIERLRIKQTTGNVGIGTANPLQKMHIVGNLRFDGALMPAGNAGTTGQVLVSQGAGVAPVWQSVGTLITNYKVSAVRTLITTSTFTQITGLSQTITLTSNAQVMVSTYGSLETTSSINGGSGTIVQVFNNGVAIADMFQTTDVNDAAGWTGTIAHWTMTNTITLTPGSYTFTVRARKYAFDNFYAGGNTTAPNPNEGALIITVFPQ